MNTIQGICIVLFGPPGTGKSELGKRIQENYSKHYISTGDMLRNLREIQAPEPDYEPGFNPIKLIDTNVQVTSSIQGGDSNKIDTSSGDLISDEVVNRLLFGAISQEILDGCIFILDGYPRNVEQAKTLAGLFMMPNYKCISIYLTADRNLLVERILNRGLVTGRTDDTAEVINKRLDIFERDTLPVFDFLRGTYSNPTMFWDPIDTTHLTLDEVYEKVEEGLKILEII
jgi:adenylate kinase